MMLNLRETALAVSGHLAGDGDIAFSRVTTDSRDIRAGDLFIALKGERFDGHAFAADALARGAVAVVVEAGLAGGNQIVVADTLVALGVLARYWRNKIAPVVVAITGSNGKTTVKEMTAAVLAHCMGSEAVLATQGNLNNHIGVPLTLLSLRAGHRYAVVEMGMNHFGEIDYLTRMAEPDVALVNNAGSAHLEALGSVEGVARAKGEIFAGLRKDGTAVINADDAYAELWARLANGNKQVTFGVKTAEVCAREVTLDAAESRFILSTPHAEAQLLLPVPGMHNISNALATTAIAHALGIPLNRIADGLESYHGVKGRLQAKVAFNGARLIDDTYNANPDSMKAAIDVLVNAGSASVLVLGDIGEIGSDGPALHAEIGAYAKARGVAALYTLGEQMQHAADAFAGARHFDDVDALIAVLRASITADSAVLVKGSRFMRMERVVDALCADPQGGK
ncbi:UDP-N-acetylmuramoyl-tripeptide--D-alanyl-D-alanine ligase [Andreprevotia sp. IGB-42]|uniref:UDP-N-acetylmuramoyl-tripeptide--D-alanyl-D- alanine ligase n=1 Tax=Andreprevotia sp. IGB-42 TaxID=2497473 RepID=UPI00157F4131|nr:UDP-N-acetylmuramoyl-tripeptide--D-alanyl-D-alanine ligase [Andreprevotia sp. IGB-42]KAF0814834.1 UDP-N-acetylmuramoyl-tripeptide--D-alanyl-D-alanine ligase [Andreprevotia sp. IGB-42]